MANFKIVPHLWYTKEAEEAARFYTSIFPDSKVDAVTTMPADSPSGPAGSVKLVHFTLAGQPFQAISAGPLDAFNHAVSFMVECDSQAEIDRYWEKLGAGGSYEPCGWLRDKFGLSWQIVPRELDKMMGAADRTAAGRAAEAMMKMKKLDLDALEQAFYGRGRAKPEATRPAAQRGA